MSENGDGSVSPGNKGEESGAQENTNPSGDNSEEPTEKSQKSSNDNRTTSNEQQEKSKHPRKDPQQTLQEDNVDSPTDETTTFEAAAERSDQPSGGVDTDTSSKTESGTTEIETNDAPIQKRDVENKDSSTSDPGATDVSEEVDKKKKEEEEELIVTKEIVEDIEEDTGEELDLEQLAKETVFEDTKPRSKPFSIFITMIFVLGPIIFPFAYFIPSLFRFLPFDMLPISGIFFVVFIFLSAIEAKRKSSKY